jgi:hypothetical protein
MSIGNSKDYGNKGNNFPWQLKMLQGLEAINTTIAAQTVNTGAIRTPRLISPNNTSGTINVHVHSISVYNSGNAVGTLVVSGGAAVNIPVGATINMDAGGNNNRFPPGAFVYNATGTTFLIAYVA